MRPPKSSTRKHFHPWYHFSGLTCIVAKYILQQKSPNAASTQSPSRARFNASDEVVNEEAVPAVRSLFLQAKPRSSCSSLFQKRSPDAHSAAKPQSPSKARFNASDEVVNEEAVPVRLRVYSSIIFFFRSGTQTRNAVPLRLSLRLGLASMSQTKSSTKRRYHRYIDDLVCVHLLLIRTFLQKSATAPREAKSPSKSRFNASDEIVNEESVPRRAVRYSDGFR